MLDTRQFIRDINKLAVPAIIFNVTEPLIGLVDTAIIGQIGADVTNAQAGVGLASGLISVLIWGLAQMRTAISAIVSQYLGKNKLGEILTLVPQTLLLALFIGFLFYGITALFYNDLSALLYSQSSSEVQAYASEYYLIRSAGLPLSLFIATVFGVFRGMQNTSWAMYICLIGGIINLILDIVLVLGIEGMVTPLGVAGAAWASVSAQLIMALMCVLFMHIKTPFGFIPGFRISPELPRMISISLNMLIRTLALNLAFIFSLRFANFQGAITTAAYAIGINIWLFCSYFIDGYSNAGNALAGKFLGQADQQSLKKMGWLLVKINVVVATGLGLCGFIVYGSVGELFNSNVGVVATFNSFFWMVLIIQPVNSVAFSLDGVFKGLGEAKLLRNNLILGTFLVYFPVLLIFDYLSFGIFAVWLALMFWMVFRAGYLFVKFRNFNI